MAPTQDRASAKIAELKARGLAKGSSTTPLTSLPTPAARLTYKAAAVVIPAYRSVEELRGPAGATLLPKVELPLDALPLPASVGRGHGVTADADEVGLSQRSDNTGSKTQDAPFDSDGAPIIAASTSGVVAVALTGLLAPKHMQLNGATTRPAAMAETVGTSAAAVPRATAPRRPPGFSSLDLPDDRSTSAQSHPVAGVLPAAQAPVLKPAQPGVETAPRQAGSEPTEPGTPPERALAPCVRSVQENIDNQRKETGAAVGTSSNGDGSNGLGAQQRLSPPPPCTPQPTLPMAAGGLMQSAGGIVAPLPAQPLPPGVAAPPMTAQLAQQQPRTLRPTGATAACAAASAYFSTLSGDGNNSAVDMGHVNVTGVDGPYCVGVGAAMGAPCATAQGYSGMDPGYVVHMQEQHMAQQLLLRHQQQQQMELHRQIQYQQQTYQHHLAQQQKLQVQEQQRAQRLLQQQMQQQRRTEQRQGPQSKQGGRHLTPTSLAPSTQRPPDQLRPPQRPRPYAAFGADVKGVEVTLARALALLFRREPKLFRDVYGFGLDWWLAARGKPLSEAGDDLLVATVFHNYAAVMVRLDRGAAPGWVGSGRHKLLNPTASALLHDRVYGNALMLRLSKLDGVADGAAGTSNGCKGAAPGGGTAVQVQQLTPVQAYACFVESDNVAWQMEWHRELAPGLAESLSSDDRAGWLTKLPVTPLDEQGEPDIARALALVRETFKLPPSATRGLRTTGACPSGEEAGASMGVTGAVPAELAPLLRALRCASPWCLPSRRRGPVAGVAQRGGGRGAYCPFGHYWRSLTIGERNKGLGPTPVFNAARNCTGRPLEPGLCPALIDRLEQLGWGVATEGDEAELKSDASRAPVSNSSRLKLPDLAFAGAAAAVQPSTGAGVDGIFAAGAPSDDGDEDDDKAEADEEDNDDEDEDDVPAPALKNRRLRQEDLTFYLSFCKEGPRCRRCHSFYELQLAETLQRLTGGAGGGGGFKAPIDTNHATRGLHRCGFQVLAALMDDVEFVDDAVKPADMADTATASSEAAAHARTPGNVTAPVAPAASAGGTDGSSFRWADEPEPESEATAAAARPSAQPPARHPRTVAFGPAPLAPRRRPSPSFPPPAAAEVAATTVAGWSSRAPFCCYPVGDAARPSSEGPLSQRHDMRPMPTLPDTLDLELGETPVGPDRAAVAVSMATKSRNGVYIPPHLRAMPVDEAAGAYQGEQAEAAEDAALPTPAGELPPAELHSTAAVAEAAPPPLGLQQLRSSAPPTQAAGPMFSPLRQLPLGEPLRATVASVPPRGPHAGVQPPGFHQPQAPAQIPVVPIPVPVPSPAPARAVAPAQTRASSDTQLQGVLYRAPLAAHQQHVLQGPPPFLPVAPALARPIAAEAEDDLVDCMSLCGLSSAEDRPPPPPLAQFQASAATDGQTSLYDGFNGFGNHGNAAAEPMPAPPPAPSAYSPFPTQPSGGANLQAHPFPLPPYTVAPGAHHGGRPAMPFTQLSYSGPPGTSYAHQLNDFQPPQWPEQHLAQQQHQLQQQYQQQYKLPQQQTMLEQQEQWPQQLFEQQQQHQQPYATREFLQGHSAAVGQMYGIVPVGLRPPLPPAAAPPQQQHGWPFPHQAHPGMPLDQPSPLQAYGAQQQGFLQHYKPFGR